MRRYNSSGTDIAEFDAVRLAVASQKIFWTGAMVKSPNRKPSTIALKNRNVTVCFVNVFLDQLKTLIRMTLNTKAFGLAKRPLIRMVN